MGKEIENIKTIRNNIQKLYAQLDYQLTKTKNRFDKINKGLLKVRKIINEQLLDELRFVYEIPIEFADD